MASKPALDLDTLLAPISADVPCGLDPQADLSHTAPFVMLKDAYEQAREAERLLMRGFEEAADTRKAEQDRQQGWALVCERAPPIITTIGKDVRVAVWLTEALLRRRGIAGLRDGLMLTAGLVEQYWDCVFPQPDESGDPEDDPRRYPFAALDRGPRECRLAPALRQVALSDADEPIRFWECEPSSRPAADQETAEARIERIRRSTAAFKRDLVEDADACVAAATRLEAALGARYQTNSLGFSGLREIVGQIADLVRPHADLAAPEVEPAESTAGDAPAAPVEVAPTLRRGTALDRDSAFRQLQEIAAFFRQTEPHSPIAYALENIVRRGRMTLPELLRELITDEAARQNYFLSAGMRPPEDKGA